MNRQSLPVACSLTDAELQRRRETVLEKVRRAVVGTRELDDGYAYRLPANEEWLTTLVNLVNLERQCCPFLRFNIIVEPGDGPLWLELTGPPGTKEFLVSTLR